MPDCSIIIPVHNRASLTRQCLNRLLELSAPARAEIIVVDGASTDITAELLRSYGDKIRSIRLTDPRGFAVSCNQGAAMATGNVLIFLNNDTLPQPDWLENLLQYAHEHPRAAVVGAKLLYPDDTIQHAGVVICQDRYPRHIYAGFPADHPAVSKSRPFQIVTAACALVRRELFTALNGFDTRYVNGYEDVDLCLRLGAAGYEIHYCHTAVLYHLESVTRSLQALEQNLKLYREHWMERVVPDEFRYYLDDGLIEVHYSPSYPFELKISPLLSTFQDSSRQAQLEHLLHLRARESSQQRREIVELYAALGEKHFADTLQINLPAQTHSALSTRSYPSFPTKAAARTAPPRPEFTEWKPPHAGVGRLPATVPARVVAQGTIRPLQAGTNGPLYSILLPVKNGANRLPELLARVLAQQAEGNIEIIAVDSGSDDDSIEILKQYNATVLAIPPEKFNHGLTRNLAANYAHGDVFIFLNQSALPVDGQWLTNLVTPLAQAKTLAGVCSRLVPYENDDPLVRRDVLRDLNSAVESRVSAITDWNAYETLSPDARRHFINFHSISAAIRPQVLERIPLPAVPLIGEDLSWGKQVLEAGYSLRQEASSVVFHSHAYSHTELLQRNFDDAVLNRALVGRQIDAMRVMPGIVAAIQDDWRYLEQARELSPMEREQFRVESVMRRTAQWVGQWLGGHLDDLPVDAVSHLALTERIKLSGGTQATDDEHLPHDSERDV